MARIAHLSVRADDPIWMLTAPIPATEYAVKKSGIQLSDIGLVEINEAFASVAMAWQKEMEYPMDQINISGGAIALGHPLGATGCPKWMTKSNCSTAYINLIHWVLHFFLPSHRNRCKRFIDLNQTYVT